MENLESQIIALQERIAWLESMLEEVSTAQLNLLRRLNAQEREIEEMKLRQNEPAAVRPLSEETPPPHY